MTEYITEWVSHNIEDPFVREEIVRCRDCKHYDPYPTDGGVCFLPDGDGDFARWEVEPDGFCKWGEPKMVGK